jgi:predicted AAA+ superfamily ATPase
MTFSPMAYRWAGKMLEAIKHIDPVYRGELIGLEQQIELTEKNILSFLSGGPYLDMLLWGERGAGKSSLIKMLLTEHHEQGLRAVEFRQEDIEQLHWLYNALRDGDSYRYMVFFDDISFDRNDILFRHFKSALEGGLEKRPENCMFVATSNMRHMIPDKAADTNDIYSRDEENEKISLKARFGINIGFYPIRKELYLKISEYYLQKYEIAPLENWESKAENYAVNKGGRSGRVARQFAVACRLGAL